MISTHNSRQRQVILEELRKMHSHPTAADLYAAVRRRLPRISLATVYRNLELLERQGHVRRLEGYGAQARFDGDLGEHLHLRCVTCGGVTDIARPRAPAAGRLPRAPRGHLLFGLRLEYTGVCPRCRAKLAPQRLAELRRIWR